jgi:hypothetical protein
MEEGAPTDSGEPSCVSRGVKPSFLRISSITRRLMPLVPPKRQIPMEAAVRSVAHFSTLLK